MAKLGDIEIADKSSPFTSGAAFKLSTRPRYENLFKLDSVWEVETKPGNSYIVVRGNTAVDATSAFNLAYEVAQKGMDWLCAVGRDNLAIIDASTEYFVWWREDTKQVLRFVGIGYQSMSMEMTIEVKDKDGNPVPPQPGPAPVYHESLRYFRISQVTEDLFEAYRNLWLAFELLLSYKYPRGRGQELDWLENSLRDIHSELNLANAVQVNGSDVAQELIDELYKGVRLKLFHAKENRGRLMPHKASDKQKVSEALEKLAKLVIFLNQNWLNIGRSSAWMSPGFHNEFFRKSMTSASCHLSDFEGPFTDGLTVKDMGNIVSMHHSAAPELSRPGLEQELASISSEELQGLSVVRYFFVADESRVLISQDFMAELTPEGIDRFEVQLGLQLAMAQQPKSLYKL
jgi:hypothetical protein